jgi:hypothetical protein
LEEIGLWQKKIPLYQPAVSHGIKNRGDKEALEKLRSLGYIQ